MSEDIRARLRAAYSFDWLKTQLDELTQATRKRTHSVTCKHCKREGRYELDESDDAVRLKALQYIGDMGYGKAAPAPQDKTTAIPAGKQAQDYTPEERRTYIALLQQRLTTPPNPDISRGL
jgi:hypothetical protein